MVCEVQTGTQPRWQSQGSSILQLRGSRGNTNLSGIAAELLAQGEGRGVLCVRAPYLDDVVPLVRPGLQGGMQLLQSRDHMPLQGQSACYVHHCRGAPKQCVSSGQSLR